MCWFFKKMFSRRFVPLEVRPVVIERLAIHPPAMEQPKALANDDVEDITDDEEEVRKPNQQQNVIVVNKPQIIVVKKQPTVKPAVVKQNDAESNVISAEFDSLIDDIVACYEIEKREEEKEKRRKERQRIKRKKANKRRYQKMLWARRYKHKI